MTTSLSRFLQWKTPTLPRGILTGASENQEYLLPHWWRYMRAACQEPVSFIDFGMTKSARQWCAKRGEVITCTLPDHSIKKREEIPPITAKFWERIYPGNLWQARKIWFLKPPLLLQTPYQSTLWIDLDCEVREPISELFDLAKEKSGLAVARALDSLQKAIRVTGLLRPNERAYNPGVIAFHHHSLAVFQWAVLSLTRNEEFFGDETSLSRALLEGSFEVTSLPITYNCPFFYSESKTAKIVHFCTASGKRALYRRITL